MNWIKKIYSSFEGFWFAPQPLIVSSLFRVAVGSTLALFYLERLFDFDFLFSEKGLVPYSLSIAMVPPDYQTPFLLYPSSESLLFGLHIVFVLGLLLLALGIGGRVVALVCWVLHLMFVQRNAVVTYGPDFMATCWLMYLWLLKSDAYLTLPQLLKKKGFWPTQNENVGLRKGLFSYSKMGGPLNTVGLRFIQLQTCIVYGYGGLEKMKGVTWWRGEAIWNTLANGQLVTHDFGFVANVPLLIVFLTFSTLLFEVYFPALIWNPKVRPWLLGFGLFLHAGIGFTMNIPFFSILMLCSYISFLPIKSQ